MNSEKLFERAFIAKASMRSGLYWLYQNTEIGLEVVYLGISRNIRRRLMEHNRQKNFDSFFYEEVDYSKAKDKERFLLEGYKMGMGRLPLFNKKVG